MQPCTQLPFDPVGMMPEPTLLQSTLVSPTKKPLRVPVFKILRWLSPGKSSPTYQLYTTAVTPLSNLVDPTEKPLRVPVFPKLTESSLK